MGNSSGGQLGWRSGINKRALKATFWCAMITVCPLPRVWAPLYQRLHCAWIEGGRQGVEPPIPLILDGWHYSSDCDKQERWVRTVEWAKAQNLSHLIPCLTDADLYSVECLSTSYPGQHYRVDRYEVRERPSSQAIERAIEILRAQWGVIVGDALALVCEPVSITGEKARRLLVRVTAPFVPAWGSWTKLSSGPEKRHSPSFGRGSIEQLSRCMWTTSTSKEKSIGER
jgi:hypothetical protein